MITAILPVSREVYLERVLKSLRTQTLKPDSLIVIFDGSDEDYIRVRNRIVEEPYTQLLCLKSENARPAFSIPERRQHISNIHNQFNQFIGHTDWIFSVEDDGILPNDALLRLVRFVEKTPNVGIVTGVELGRWGVPYVGAWKVDDFNKPKQAISMENRVGEDLIEEIDGCGLYCALINPEVYRQHTFDSKNGLGPDVNLGLFSRQLGFKNYIDWNVPVTHLTNMNGLEVEIPATDNSQIVTLSLLGNNTWAQHKTGQHAYGKL